ncbi:GntR family transcriptional regulator [Streptomyces sp. BA2]|uniref:GntR family transcriptional regulator n=1 Tax=Streptomyces sp. BA2 TaxID=436595 RepID=UPI001F0205CB|nr:GntR family transcriptional regulator [Streptomyces sp. BA2]
MEFAPDKARWRQVAEVIQNRIEDGTYPPRTRVPSVVQLTAEFGIANATAHKVLTGLRAKGLTYTESGLGSSVSPASRSKGLAESEDTQPVWRQVASAIATRITDGSYPVGARVPSALELSAEFEIATSTAQKVLAHLKDEGLVRAEVGLGSFVAERADEAGQ